MSSLSFKYRFYLLFSLGVVPRDVLSPVVFLAFVNGNNESGQVPISGKDWCITSFVSLGLCGAPSFVITKYCILGLFVCLFVSNANLFLFITSSLWPAYVVQL